MTFKSIVCESCNQSISGEIYHLGFSMMNALYCSGCSNVLLIKDFSFLERQGFKYPDLMAHDPGFQPYGRHLLEYYRSVESLFDACSCGGEFKYMNSPRCPSCKGLLKGDAYEDKPVLKETDQYVFVSQKSFDDVQKIKRDYLKK